MRAVRVGDPLPQEDENCPLYVDLDGTVLATDLGWESVLLLIRNHPLDALKTPFWLLRGLPYLKKQIADRVSIDPASLPYRQEVLEYLREQRTLGRRLVMASASEQRVVTAVAGHLGLFDQIIATNGGENLKGEAKLSAIRAGGCDGVFDYAGDSSADLPLWKACRRAIVVAPGAALLQRVGAVCSPHKVFEKASGGGRSILRMMRPHQWAKNLLLVVPLVMSHQVRQWDKLLHMLLAFISFCAAASAIYIWNDLLDLSSDRRHARKRNRPLASGRVKIPTALAVSFALLFIAFAISLAALPLAFSGSILLYLAVTTAYSMYFKRKLMLDVLCLAGLYTLRLVAGGAAVSVVLSQWLLAFSMFFFVSLAFAKRYTELDLVNEPSTGRISGRGYLLVDLELIRTVGPSSGYLSVLVLCLYISSAEVVKLYKHPSYLWFVCPVLLYWITRIWFLAQRKHLDEDPVVFALRDRHSFIAGALTLVILVAASI